ncbi:MAG TPA: cell envelope integrity protein TolA [Chakrabartia sp.]|nr:cell envelope integrity protein TolA [Chakrabartia sp.]
MTRSERTGLSLALMGHVALLAALSLSLINRDRMPDIVQEPMGVELVDEADLGSGLPSPAPLAGAVPDNQPAPVTDAVPMPAGPTPAELAAEAARKRADAQAAEAREKAAQEAKAAADAAAKVAAAERAAKQSRDAAAAKAALVKAQAEAKLAKQKADAAKKAAEARDAAVKAAQAKAAAEKAAREKAARETAARAAQAAKDKAAKDAAARAAQAVKDKAAKDAAAKAAAAKAAAEKAKQQGKGGTGLKDIKLDGKDNSAGNTPDKGGLSAGEATKAITISLANAVAPRFQRCAPSGFDTNLIITPITLRINKDGSLAGVDVGTQTGINDNNQTQAGPLKACAIKAAQAAAPFTNLPKDHYNQWANWRMRLKTK